MLPGIRIPTREAALQFFGRLSVGRIFGDPRKFLDFPRGNVIFAYQPTQAVHDMRWLDASSRGAPDSFSFALSWLPIELCREPQLASTGIIKDLKCRPQIPLE
jgi:hypothetical protein